LGSDSEGVALYELGVPGSHGEGKGGGPFKFGSGRKQPLRGIEECRRGHQQKGKDADEGEGGEAKSLTRSAIILDLVERHLVQVIGEVLHGMVNQRSGRVAPFALSELEQVHEPVGHGGVMATHGPCNVLLRRAGKEAKPLA
jgi:hypothetical protein